MCVCRWCCGDGVTRTHQGGSPWPYASLTICGSEILSELVPEAMGVIVYPPLMPWRQDGSRASETASLWQLYKERGNGSVKGVYSLEMIQSAEALG